MIYSPGLIHGFDDVGGSLAECWVDPLMGSEVGPVNLGHVMVPLGV